MADIFTRSLPYRSGRQLLTHTEVERLLRRLTEVVLTNSARLRKKSGENALPPGEHEAYPSSPRNINYGWCPLWAILARRLVGGELMATHCHVFLQRQDLCYDAECPEGTVLYVYLPYWGGVHIIYGDKDEPESITQECAWDGWGCNIPLASPPFHWLKDLTDR